MKVESSFHTPDVFLTKTGFDFVCSNFICIKCMYQ